jgi:pteridine reductase
MGRSTISGKTALVTGAAKRIGRAIAHALADEGVNVVVHYRGSTDEAKELAAELREKRVSSWTVQADFDKPQERDTLIQRAVEAAGTLDILVNNASIFPAETLDELSFDSLMKNIEINAWTPFALSRDFARQVGRGKIINLIDSRVSDTDWSHAGYIISKHALAALTDMIALAYAPDITVNGVSPGLILPPPGKDESYIEKLTNTVPLKKHGDPKDIADAVVFLAKSDFITGEVIYVDGGRHLREYSNG